MTRARSRWPRSSPRRAATPRTVRAPRLASTVGWYVVLTAIAVITVFPFFWMLSTSLKGPLDPITSVPPQFIPSNPTLANYERVLGALPIPRFFLNSVIVSVAVGAAQRAGRRAGRLPAGQDAVPRPERDLLPAAGDADRAGPADLHPELRPRGERLPLLRHAAGADLPEPRQRVQHLPAAPGVPRASPTTCSTRPGSTAPASGGSGGRSCCRSSGRRWPRSRSSRSSRRGTTSCGRR